MNAKIRAQYHAKLARSAQRYSRKPRLAAVIEHALYIAPRLPNLAVGRNAVRGK
jgi:hypothetical protein